MTAYGTDKELDARAVRMIANEVLACQSALVEMLIDTSYLDWDSIANLTKPTCPECGTDDVELDCTAEKEHDYECNDWGHTFDMCDAEHEPREVLEWWLVTPRLASDLESEGETIATDDANHWWGRCTSGQAILLDGIIQRIVQD